MTPDASPPVALPVAGATAPAIADALVSTALDVVERLALSVAPGLALPATLAGHRVEADAHADLVFTLGLLHEAGVGEVAGRRLDALVHERLASIDAARTHTFFSYRVAETAARLGGLGALEPPTAEVVAEAADSTEWIELLDTGLLPRNYAVVLARCETARAGLGLDVDAAVLDDLVARVAALLGEHPDGWLDDSHDGRGQVDMYTVDAYLFAAPLAGRLGEVWPRGLSAAARLVEAVASPGGEALPWGRSIGALAVGHTAELAGALLAHGLAGDVPGWLGRARAAAGAAPGWFAADGLVVAHRRRSPFRYRGPQRRLQMTLDCAGKLVAAALDLRRSADPTSEPADSHPYEAAPPARVFPPRDEWISFGEGAGAWAHRDPRLAFTLPVVGGPGSDYAPSPRRPGAFEVPTDGPLACFVPVAWYGTNRFAPGGRAAGLGHAPGALDLAHDRFTATAAELGADTPSRPLRRRARYTIDGRTLRIDEELELGGDRPEALAVLVPEAAGQPLHVEATGDAVVAVRAVEVDGLAEWRSFQGELPAVHQVELEPGPSLAFRWSVTPKLRVVSTIHGDPYHECLYRPLRDRVADRLVPFRLLDRPGRLTEALATVDVFHLHWPEWLTGIDAGRARRVADVVAAAGVPIVWTQHNLAPHAAPDETELYQVWAERADAVIHHSEWGRAEVTARYRFRPDALHRVVPHGHWGPVMDPALSDPGTRAAARARAEAELGLAPCHLRIGLVGAPRPGKDTGLLLEGFAACRRDDLQLLVLGGGGEPVPADPRITVRPYEQVPREVYDRRLAAVDVLALPLGGGTYLTSGQPADAVAAGIPALTSDWPYLAEVLGDAAIPYGRTAADLTATLDGLDDATVARARRATAARRAALDWDALSRSTWDLLDEVAARATLERPR